MTDAGRDERMVALQEEWGLEGYARWWKILELIAEQMDEKNQGEVHYRAGFIARSLGFRSLIDCRSFVHWLAINGLLIVDLSSNEWLLKCPKLAKIRAHDWSRSKQKFSLDIDKEEEVDKELSIVSQETDLFWKEFQSRNGSKGSKKKALAQWNKLTESEKEKVLPALEAQKQHYANCKLSGIFVSEFPDAWRWLRDKRFNDEIEIQKTWQEKFMEETSEKRPT